MELGQLLRGMGRGASADIVGAPVDLATLLTNLGIAGVGYAGHKLGLVKQPPALLEGKDVVGSSDWFAKNTPLEGEGSSYEAGRLVPAALTLPFGAAGGTVASKAIGKAAELLRGPAKKQAGALYKGGRPDLTIYHGYSADEGLPRELTHPSFAVTGDNNRVISAFGNDYLVPRPSALDPRTTPSVIRPTDFYSPRHGASASRDDMVPPEVVGNMAKRVYDDMQRGFSKEQAIERSQAYYNRELTKVQASSRLKDRALGDVLRGRDVGHGGNTEGFSYENLRSITPSDVRDKANLGAFEYYLAHGKNFRSFKEFENTPGGANRLDTNPDLITEYIRDLVETGAYDAFQPGAAKAFNERNITHPVIGTTKGVQFGNIRNDWGALRNADKLQKHVTQNDKPITQEQAKNLAEFMRAAYDRQFIHGGSEYAEVKRYGPMQINPDNFLGTILRGPAASELRMYGDLMLPNVERGIEDAVKYDIPFRVIKGYGNSNEYNDLVKQALRQMLEENGYK